MNVKIWSRGKTAERGAPVGLGRGVVLPALIWLGLGVLLVLALVFTGALDVGPPSRFDPVPIHSSTDEYPPYEAGLLVHLEPQ